MNKTILIIPLLIVGLLILAGCTGSNTPNPPPALSQVSSPSAAYNPTDTGVVVSAPAPPAGSGTAGRGMMGGGGMMTNNKTGYQQVQQTIAAAVADGTYPVEATYYSPGGAEVIDFTVTVQGDVITAASCTPVQGDRMGMRYMSNFNNALPSMVIGQKIDQLSIPRNLAGSSLTTGAFAQYVSTLVANHGAPPA